jgi:nicotinamidase-related amidase
MPSFDLDPARSHLLLIDMQERFLPVIPAMAENPPDGEQICGKACKQLLAGAALLGVATTITEQYPKGLGATLGYLAAAAPAAARLTKMHFSAWDDAAARAHFGAGGREQFVLCGVEAHVCVLHTAADLLAAGKTVVVAGDAVASRSAPHRAMALATLRDLGALVVPAESVLMRWQRVAGTPAFKAISALIR